MKNLFYSVLVLTLIWGCKSNGSNHEHDHAGHDHSDHSGHNHGDHEGFKVGDYKFVEAVSQPFTNAELKIASPSIGASLLSGQVDFDFDVANYELGSQTGHTNAKACANSAKGQHIHLILNNQPYSAHYTSEFEKDLEDGDYVGLAFLSRSYHESIKSSTAYQVFDFTVGDNVLKSDFDKTAPHMFYSRPKGTYVGKDTKNVMLDFYLTNVDLSEDGYKVKAKINDSEVLLTKWAPYLMEGLPMGENSIELTLLDPEGKPVNSPFNPVTRTVVLSAE